MPSVTKQKKPSRHLCISVHFVSYIALYMIIKPTIFLLIISNSMTFAPQARFAHSAVLVRRRIYVFGGQLPSQQPDNGMFLLSFTGINNTAPLNWTDLSPVSKVPVNISWSTAVFGKSLKSIFAFGGIMLDSTGNETGLLLKFNTTSKTWEKITASGTPPVNRRECQAVIDDENKIYIFGGSTSSATGSNTTNWSVKVATGHDIDGRASHSAVLTNDGKIIVYGGFKDENEVAAFPQLIMLDTNTSTFTWSTPPVNAITAPPALKLHTATLYGNYMIVAFESILITVTNYLLFAGRYLNTQTVSSNTNPNVYIFDLTTFAWQP
ncbi:12722_t:CDS:2, partial [Acaulospora morrowiae]